MSQGSGNGDLTISAKAGGGVRGTLLECGSTINCSFASADLVLGVRGGNPAHLTATEVELARMGGLCPVTSKWDANYEIAAPKPLFLTSP